MCQEAVRKLCNPSESSHVRKVARLLARPLSRGSLDGHWLPPAWHPRRDRGQRVLLRRRGCRYGSRALLAPGALGPCSLLPTCSSFSYPLRTLAGQTLPTRETLVARLLLLKLLYQYLALPTPVAACESFLSTVPMRTLLEPAGFFFEAPVPGFLPSLHLLTSSLLRLQRFVLATSHIGTYALPTALRYQNVQQKERGMSVFPGRRTS